MNAIQSCHDLYIHTLIIEIFLICLVTVQNLGKVHFKWPSSVCCKTPSLNIPTTCTVKCNISKILNCNQGDFCLLVSLDGGRQINNQGKRIAWRTKGKANYDTYTKRMAQLFVQIMLFMRENFITNQQDECRALGRK